MILNMYCTEHSLLTIEVYSTEVEACNMIFPPTPLGNQYSLSNVTSYCQGLSSSTGKILGTRLDVFQVGMQCFLRFLKGDRVTN